MSEKKLK